MPSVKRILGERCESIAKKPRQTTPDGGQTEEERAAAWALRVIRDRRGTKAIAEEVEAAVVTKAKRKTKQPAKIAVEAITTQPQVALDGQCLLLRADGVIEAIYFSGPQGDRWRWAADVLNVSFNQMVSLGCLLCPNGLVEAMMKVDYREDGDDRLPKNRNPSPWLVAARVFEGRHGDEACRLRSLSRPAAVRGDVLLLRRDPRGKGISEAEYAAYMQESGIVGAAKAVERKASRDRVLERERQDKANAFCTCHHMCRCSS
jgi:hypothetical protein